MCWILTSAKLGTRCILGIHINDWEQHQQDRDFQSVQKNRRVKKSGSKTCSLSLRVYIFYLCKLASICKIRKHNWFPVKLQSAHAVPAGVKISLCLFISSVKSALLAMFSHGGRKQICLLKPPLYPAAQEQYARSEFSRRSRKVTLQNTRSTCGFFFFPSSFKFFQRH